ncbi:activator-dependent family glycosyltransferase [Streptomyces katsurahamanus]|uniref:Activator-dependent family glycosyltransferase n=1 Tax=Streptomyces katsurahamanus TaxID=2577098 RepID=A0ABW9NMH7_9ACTN|nr:activator-dependent family glycosyltransferase [Streptomyces katsurahamanus]MQS34516.1 activator-dependent family glycosyltransferase [Streptomyces katsurahamanus]
MRILFVTNPFRAHLYVQVPLAWALRTAGHEVCVAGPPDLADAVARTGWNGVSVGERLALEEKMPTADATAETVDACDPRGHRTGRSVQSDFGWGDAYTELEDLTTGVREVFFPDSAFDDLVDFARQWRPDLVITDPTAFPGAVAARVVGAAHARMMLNVDRVGQLRAACRDRLDADGDPMREWLGPILERYGSEFDEAAVLGQWSISPTPPWIPQPDGAHYLPMRSVPFNGPSPTPRWVYEQPARRRVCITQGLSHRDATIDGASSSTRDLFDAVADLDVEVIATLDAKQLDSVSKIPENVRTVDFVPFTSLLPSCSAIVHEGGVGSFATALQNGVPQIIVPNDFRVEKWWGPVAIGTGLESRGAGVYAANSSTLTPETLRRSLQLVLDDPSYLANAVQLRTELKAMPTPNDIVPALEKLTAEYRTSRP